MHAHTDTKIVFFGTPDIAVRSLDALEEAGIVPELVVTAPDAPQGRKQIVTPPPVKVWAESRHVPVFQPERFIDPADSAAEAKEQPLVGTDWDLFVVVAYGRILPKWLIELPRHGTLNLHPSLLPKLRGASPIRSAILEDMRGTGVTIMHMDEKLDHGPILAQETAEISEDEWPLPGRILDERLAKLGGDLLARTIPQWRAGEIIPQKQDHAAATYCKKITRVDSELAFDPFDPPSGDAAYRMLLKIRAYDGWPGTYFMHKGKRIKITDAERADDGTLRILHVIPEGKKEIVFTDWLRTF